MLNHNEVIEHKIMETETDGTQKCYWCETIITEPGETPFSPGVVYQYEENQRSFGNTIAPYITAISCQSKLKIN